jgi:hypothetical protein
MLAEPAKSVRLALRNLRTPTGPVKAIDARTSTADVPATAFIATEVYRVHFVPARAGGSVRGTMHT